MDADANDELNAMLKQVDARTRRNLVRKRHYEFKNTVQRVAAVLPPAYASLGLTLGWSAKAVDMLARRCRLSTFTSTGPSLDDLGYQALATDNAFASEVGQGLTSSLLYASAFVSTVAGEEGEPDVGVHFFDALDATGLWNARTRRLKSAISIDDRNDDGRPVAITMHSPGIVRTIVKDGGKWAEEDVSEHDYGMTMDLLPYRPRTGRPFGASRLSRPMMSIQNMAIRELLRLEGHMDVYSFPELWMLGADLSIFGENADVMQVMLGRLKGVPDDENSKRSDGGRVDVKQIDASSPEPHLAALNGYAKLFARESGLPDSSLAITDLANPTSAESYDASQYDLIAEAEGATDDWTAPLTRTVARALAIKNRDPKLVDALASQIAPKWRNPKYISRAAEADAGLKQLTAYPRLQETEVGLELVGLTDDQARRARAEMARLSSSSRVTQLLAQSPAPVVESE